MPKAITKRAKKIRKPKPEATGGFIAALPTTAGLTVGPNVALTLSAVYRAVTVISSTLGSLPVHLHKFTTTEGQERRERVRRHPVAQILSRSPNPEMTPLAFKEYIGRSLCLWGNFYGLIEWAGGAMRDVKAIWPLPPSSVRVQRGPAPQEELEYAVLDGSGYETIIESTRILHIKLFGDGMVGKSPISLARESIALGLAAETFGAAFFGNATMPSGIITTPEDMTPERRANFIRQIESRHMGPSKGWRLMVADEGYKWQSIGIPPKDAQFLDTRVFQIQDVARWFGIPPHMLAENSRATFNNIAEQSMEFVRDTIRPYCVRIEQEFDKRLLERFPDHYTKFDVHGLLRANPEMQAEFYRKMFEMGVYSTNDILELEDRNPVGPEGDVRFISVNMQSLEQAGKEPEPAPEMPALPPPPGVEDEEEPNEPSPEVKAAFRRLFRDAVGRLVHRELTALREMIGKAEEADDLDEYLRQWCHRHEDVVAGILRPVWHACEDLAGVDIVDEAEASRHVEDLRKRALGILRKDGLPGLRSAVEKWENLRADSLLDQYIELAGLNGSAKHADTDT